MDRIRARIVAVVSSSEQAADDRASLPLQVERARAAIVAHNWREVAEPISMAQSRDFIYLSDLRAASPEYDELCSQIERGELDLIVGRDHSRVFGRTVSLQSEFRTLLQLYRVQAFFYSRPVEPVEPRRLGRRGRPQAGGDYGAAVAAVSDEEEVARLVARREDGMNEHARRGRWRLAQVPFGYKRDVLETGDRRLLGRMRLDETLGPLLSKAGQLYLDGETTRSLAPLLTAWTGRDWIYSMVARLLSNPAYAGILVWGRSRRDIKPSGKTVRKISRQIVSPARMTELAEGLLRGDDLRTDEERLLGVVIAHGDWDPVYGPELWLAIQAERKRRSGIRPHGRGGHLLTGIAYCGFCGGPLRVVGAKTSRRTGRRRSVYGCASHNDDIAVCKTNYASADWLHESLFDVLRRILNDEQLAHSLASPIPAVEPAPDPRMADLRQRIAGSDLAVQRLLDAYEAGAITLVDFRQRSAPHKSLASTTRHEIAALAAARPTPLSATDRLNRLRTLAGRLEEYAERNPRLLREKLNQLIRRIVVKDGTIVSVDFH